MLDENARITHENLRHCSDGEDPSYWACGERTLTVELPNGRRRNFTGKTHLPTPTKVIWYNNANFLNQAKWIYNIIVNVLPKVDMIVDQQIEWTGSAEYADVVLPVNSWVESGLRVRRLVLQSVPASLEGRHQAGSRYDRRRRWSSPEWPTPWPTRPATSGSPITSSSSPRRRPRSTSSASSTTRRPRAARTVRTTSIRCIAGEYGGEPGAALMLFRTYPRVPFWEQIHDSIPFYTDSGRLRSYCDLPEAIEYGENLIVHREGVEATPYLPNVIVSTSPFIRPVDFGIPLDTIDPDLRQVRNVKMSWSEVEEDGQSAVEAGLSFFCYTPKSRHSTHSSWSTVDWHWIWSDNFGDPHRTDKRAPGVADRADSDEPAGGQRLGPERRRLRLGRRQRARPARTSAGRTTPARGTRRFAAWCA